MRFYQMRKNEFAITSSVLSAGNAEKCGNFPQKLWYHLESFSDRRFVFLPYLDKEFQNPLFLFAKTLEVVMEFTIQGSNQTNLYIFNQCKWILYWQDYSWILMFHAMKWIYGGFFVK